MNNDWNIDAAYTADIATWPTRATIAAKILNGETPFHNRHEG